MRIVVAGKCIWWFLKCVRVTADENCFRLNLLTYFAETGCIKYKNILYVEIGGSHESILCVYFNSI